MNTPKNFKVIQFKGALDENSVGNARRVVDELMQKEIVRNLVFDLTDLSYINSKGIGFLVSVHAHTSKNQQKLTLVHPNEEVMDVLALVGIPTIIDTFESLDEAYNTVAAE